MHARKIDIAVCVVRKAEHIRCERGELSDDLRSVRGGQQTDLSAQQAGRESDREAVPVRAVVDHMSAGGKCRRDMRHVFEKALREDRHPGAVSDYRVGRCVRYQRERGQMFYFVL